MLHLTLDAHDCRITATISSEEMNLDSDWTESLARDERNVIGSEAKVLSQGFCRGRCKDH